MLEQIKQNLLADTTLLTQRLVLTLPLASYQILSNSKALLEELARYFNVNLVDGAQSAPAIDIIALEAPAPTLDVDWQDWAREPGKTGKKDAYVDFADEQVRLIRKVRTGMVFWQSENDRLAVGPCIENPNQVINFINNQYMNLMQQQGWLICHAAALANQQKGIAFAGFSGGGKSTMMLHLLQESGFDYLTNDRLFVRKHNDKLQAQGIAKLPRVNPGTIVNDAVLKGMLTEQEIARFQNMPTDELWQLEEKYDVDVAALYGDDKFAEQPELTYFVVLNWSRSSEEPTKITRFSADEKPKLLAAIMKSCGPFFQYENGQFYQDDTELDTHHYQTQLSATQLIEVSGAVDFARLKAFCLQELDWS